jgi:1,4-dihydroxy-2-naphthoate octaprenyltransferase
MLLSFSRPDAVADRAAGKRTQLVRFGLPLTTRLHACLLGSAVILMAVGRWGAQWESGLVTAPLALFQAIGFRRVSDQVLTAGAVGLFSLATAVTGISLSGS